MKHIYRVQDADGRGPFKPGLTDKWLSARGDSDLLPAFSVYDIFDAQHRKKAPFYGCGCETIEQLKRWFWPDEWRILKKLGYFAVEMPVAEIILNDGNQVFFTRHRALNKAVKTFDLYGNIEKAVV